MAVTPRLDVVPKSRAAGLPVEELDARRRRLRVQHEHALRAQGAVDELLLVGVLERLGDLPQQAEAQVDVEALAVLEQEVVEAHGRRVVLEDERGAELVLVVVDRAEDARVLDALEDLELALGGPRQHLRAPRRWPCAAIG